MKEFMKLSGTLCIIAFLAAAMLGGVNAVTKGPIAAAAIEKQSRAMSAILSEADSFEAVHDNIYEGTKDGLVVGYCVKTSAAGYGGDIEMMVGVNMEGKIAGVEILSNSETAGLGANCTKDEFKSQFSGIEFPVAVVKGEANEGEISAITGATITSNAVAKGVNSVLDILAEAGVINMEGGGY